jgi:hypothetical protein
VVEPDEVYILMCVCYQLNSHMLVQRQPSFGATNQLVTRAF